VGLGSCYNILGNWEEAIKYLKKGIELDPSDSRGYLELGKTLISYNKLDDAQRCL
jgi:tetratricopeptide (TPR) repeat protein